MILEYIKSRLIRAPAASKSHIVVLGGGWGGYYVARGLLADARRSYNVTMVTSSDEFLYTPLLATYGFGGLSKDSLTVKYDFTRDFKMIRGSAYQVKTGLKTVDLKTSDGHQNTISYDKLVIAIGGHPATYGIPGAEKYPMTFKSFKDSQIVSQKVKSILDKRQALTNDDANSNNLLKFVFVGAGPTSLEMASELNHFIKKHYSDIKDHVDIKILDVAKSILNGSPEKQRIGVINEITKRGIRLVYPVKITAVLENEIQTDNEAIPYSMLFWNAGISPNTLLINGQKTSNRGLEVDDYLRLKGVQDVYAIGDCTRMPNPIPRTAQVAKQQATYLVKLLNNSQLTEPFKYNHGGMIIPLDSAYSSVYMNIYGYKFIVGGTPGVIINRLTTLSMLPTYSNVLSIIQDWFSSK